MKALWQIPAILFIALLIGLVYNQVRSDRLPMRCTLRENPPESPLFKEIPRISIDAAALLFRDNRAVFLDARPETFYREGHIKGALNLPWQNAEEQCFSVIGKIPQDKIVITYCDGPTCHLCDFLAKFLKEDIGFDRVFALVDGWTRWNRRNLPVESTGEQQ